MSQCKGIFRHRQLFATTILCVTFGEPFLCKRTNNDKMNIKPNSTYSFMSKDDFSNTFKQYEGKEDNSVSAKPIYRYFHNLYEYSPANSYGSCAYVSLIQYLSYYDCFYSDAIIPEIYEHSKGNSVSFAEARSVSPGVLRQEYPALSGNKLYNFLTSNRGTDYQAYLMYTNNVSLNKKTSQYECSTAMWEYENLFKQVPELCNVTFTYRSYSDFGDDAKPTYSYIRSWFNNYVKEHLDNGEPVILHIAKYDSLTNSKKGYHSVVAYYYDDSGVHANFGWGGDSTDVVIDQSNGYSITEAGVADFSSIKETHSGNYLVNGCHYCACGIETNHTYSHHYVNSSFKEHSSFCACGASIKESHILKAGSLKTIGGMRKGQCANCSGSINVSSDQFELASVNDSSNI